MRMILVLVAILLFLLAAFGATAFGLGHTEQVALGLAAWAASTLVPAGP